MKVTVRIEDNIYELVRYLAKDEGKSINQTLVDIIKNAASTYKENLIRAIEEIFEDWSPVNEEVDELPLGAQDDAVTVESVDWIPGVGLDITFVPIKPEHKTYREQMENIRAMLRYYWTDKFYLLMGDKLELALMLFEELWK